MGNGQPHRGKILIIEDNPLVRGLLVRLLSKDYGVETASSGQEAVSRLMPGYYDVVLIDQKSAGGAGDRVARAMKRIDLPLITVLIAEFDLQETDPGWSDFDLQIRKPFGDPAEVEQVVALAMQIHETRAMAMYS
jgi:CheY-like chemotaxis protein